MNEEYLAILKAISRQTTDNVPKLYIQDVESGRVFEYGKNCHDRLVISKDGRCLTYYNLQNGDGSCVGDYRFYYEKPEIITEADKIHEYEIDEWARNVEHISLTELLADEREKVCDKIYKALTSENGWHRMKNWWRHNENCEELREFLDQIQGECDEN